MNWLKEYAYLAPWLAPCITLLVAIVQNKGKFAQLDWQKLTVYLTFLISLAVLLNPTFDSKGRTAAETICFMLLGYILIDAGRSRTH